jgi:signal transduction histidine kinase
VAAHSNACLPDIGACISKVPLTPNSSRNLSRFQQLRSGRYRLYPMSLRLKLLIGFSVVFSLVFAGVYYWFYNFTTDKMMTRLRADVLYTLNGAIAGLDVDELIALYEEGDRNASGFSDDPRYLNQIEWFRTVHQIEPRAWLYTYVVKPSAQLRHVDSPTVAPDELEIIYLVDFWSQYDASKAAKFLEPEPAGQAAHRVYRTKELYQFPNLYRDRWGVWLSAAAPLRDRQGNLVAVLGLDIEADYVLNVQQAIRSRVLIAFIITYIVLVIAIQVLSSILTNRLTHLTQFSAHIASGHYDIRMPISQHTRFPDELDTLAQAFVEMVENIQVRQRIIQEGKRTEDEMRLALQEERELNELKSRFVSMVSHELRTPLTVIRTSLELLERYGTVLSDEKRKEYFDRNRSAIDRMTQLLEDVLTIGRSDAGKLQFNPTQLDLQAFCSEIVDDLQMGIRDSHPICFEARGDCSEAYVDPSLLRPILTNLLSNAVKYSPKGSPVECTLICDRHRGEATIEVTDHGIGIPTDDQPRLFQLFHRASNVNTIRGIGLGLVIVKQCVTYHQGTLTFTSQEGIGTTFVVKLPVTKEIVRPVLS